MNIAFCYESVLPARGGCETYISDLARRLVADRHDVHLYACRWDGKSLPAALRMLLWWPTLAGIALAATWYLVSGLRFRTPAPPTQTSSAAAAVLALALTIALPGRAAAPIPYTVWLLPGPPDTPEKLNALCDDAVVDEWWVERMNLLEELMDVTKMVRHIPPYVPASNAEGSFPGKCSLLGSFEQMGPAGHDASREFWASLTRWWKCRWTSRYRQAGPWTTHTSWFRRDSRRTSGWRT